MYVDGVGARGLRVRYAPQGLVVGHIPQGSRVIILEGPVVAEGHTWYRITAPDHHIEGWVAGAYLVAQAP